MKSSIKSLLHSVEWLNSPQGYGYWEHVYFHLPDIEITRLLSTNQIEKLTYLRKEIKTKIHWNGTPEGFAYWNHVTTSLQIWRNNLE